MSNKRERINNIIEVLETKGFASIKDLAKLLNVSEMTIRRDLDVIESNNIAKNVDGLLVYNSDHGVIKVDNEYNLETAVGKYEKEKSRIGKYAASLVKENEKIIIDTGTTTVHIAKNLPNNKNITVLCYNINILTEIRRILDIQILFAGGYYHSNTQLFESPQGIDYIRSIRAHKVFISAAGIHKDLGITCVENYEVATKQAIIKSSLEKILVADSSKFGDINISYFCDLSDIDLIITDNNLSIEWQNYINDCDIKLHLV